MVFLIACAYGCLIPCKGLLFVFDTVRRDLFIIQAPNDNIVVEDSYEKFRMSGRQTTESISCSPVFFIFGVYT